MNCLECLELLQGRLDGEAVGQGPEMRQHLAECPSCREQHLAAQLLLKGLQNWARPPLPAGLADRTVSRILQDRLQRRWPWRYRFSVTVALAASLLFMAVTGYLWLPTPPVAPEQAKGPAALVPMEPEPVAPPGPPLHQSVEEARVAVTSLTERLAEKTKEQAQLLWSAAPPLEVNAMPALAEMANLEEPLAPAAVSLRQTGQGMSEGLQVVARSAVRAVDYFFKELPPMDFGPNP